MLALRFKASINRMARMNEVKDLTPVYKKYKGQWVALKDDEVSVIANGEKAKDVWEKAVKKGFKNPIIFKVPSKLMPYVG